MKINYTFQFNTVEEGERFNNWIRQFDVNIISQKFFQHTDHLKDNKQYKKLKKEKKIAANRFDDFIIANKLK